MNLSHPFQHVDRQIFLTWPLGLVLLASSLHSFSLICENIIPFIFGSFKFCHVVLLWWICFELWRVINRIYSLSSFYIIIFHYLEHDYYILNLWHQLSS
jgi:hypothetical protein